MLVRQLILFPAPPSAPLVVRWKRIRTVCLSAGFFALHRVGFAATVVSHLVSQPRSFPLITDSESQSASNEWFTLHES